MPTDGPIRSAAIVGTGITGWLTAAMLARAHPDVRIEVHPTAGPDRSLGCDCPVALLLPDDLPVLGEAGFQGKDLLRECRGSFSLGTALTGWCRDASAGFIPFGAIGAPLGSVPFHQMVATMRLRGEQVNLANYSLGALCAQSGRFAPPRAGDGPVHAALTFGLHLDTARFAALLQTDALQHGVILVEPPSAAPVVADLVIDASGPDSALSGAREDWHEWFPFDAVATSLRPTGANPPPYAHLDAHASGWQSFLPLNGAVGEVLMFKQGETKDAPDAEPFRPGCQRLAWTDNVVRIGGAAAVHDPVAGLQLHIALADVMRLIALFPASTNCTAEAGEFNRQWREKTDCAFEYALLRLWRNGCEGSAWDQLRALPLPKRAAYRHDLYAANGRVSLHDGEIFEADGWVAQFDALGIRPRKADSFADAMAGNAIHAHFNAIRQALIGAVSRMSSYGALLAQVAA